jgi:hypothetical protein
MDWIGFKQRMRLRLGAIPRAACVAIASFCLLCMALGAGLLEAGPAQAVTTAPSGSAAWQLTGQSADGLAQQYVDLNSMQSRDGYWLVHSYFAEQRASGSGQVTPVRADYVTLYDCDRQRYRDLETGSDLDGIQLDSIPETSWGTVAADPLNQATLDYVCQQSAPPSAPA